jgi:hypothetical protein
MSDGIAESAAAEPALADKVNWLIDRARPAGCGPYTNAEPAALIGRVTGVRVSHTTVWKLRNGQAANLQMKADRGAGADFRRASWLLLR